MNISTKQQKELNKLEKKWRGNRQKKEQLQAKIDKRLVQMQATHQKWEEQLKAKILADQRKMMDSLRPLRTKINANDKLSAELLNSITEIDMAYAVEMIRPKVPALDSAEEEAKV